MKKVKNLIFITMLSITAVLASGCMLSVTSAVPEILDHHDIIVSDPDNQVIVDRMDNLMEEFSKADYNIIAKRVENESELQAYLDQRATDAVMMYRPTKSSFTNEFITASFIPFIENGGMVYIGWTGDAIPGVLDQWFGDVARIEMENSPSHPDRNTVWLAAGNWKSVPHENLVEETFDKRNVTQSAFVPIADGWKPYAKSLTAGGTEVPYLMRLDIGKGALFVTTANSAASGGTVIFGNNRPHETVMLIENLLKEHRER